MRRKEMESIKEPVAVRDYNKPREHDSMPRNAGEFRGGRLETGRKNK